MEQMRHKVLKKCKIRGFSLRRDALTEIFSFVRDFEDAEDEAIDLILDELQNQS
ncbi:DNA polymerase epsilon subunit B, partial [Tanacetum coccineum]